MRMEKTMERMDKNNCGAIFPIQRHTQNEVWNELKLRRRWKRFLEVDISDGLKV